MKIEFHVNGVFNKVLPQASPSVLEGIMKSKFIYLEGEEYQVEKVVFGVEDDIYTVWLGIDDTE